jgi:hypothetical protein
MIDPNVTGDFTTKLVDSVVEHWPLVVAIGIAVWKGFPWALKAFFSNGGGELMRVIIKSENVAQTQLHKEELDRRFKDHENDEQRRFVASATESKERFAAGEARFREIEEDIAYLSMGRSAQARRRTSQRGARR